MAWPIEIPGAQWGCLLGDLPGYRFGRDGSVWSCWVRGSKRHRMSADWHEVKPRANARTGYLYVTLKTPEGRKHFRVNVLILWSFTGYRPPGMDSAHKNGVRSDNRIENLEWKSRSANLDDRNAHGTMLRGEAVKGAKLNDPAVRHIRQLLSSGRSSESIAREFGVTGTIIRRIAKGKAWSHVEASR